MFQTLISSVTVGAGGSASITFSSISAAYTDLTVIYSLRTAYADVADSVLLKFNGSSTGYNMRWVQGSGSAASSSSTTSGTFINLGNGTTATNAPASTFGNGKIFIPNYAGSTEKSVWVEQVSENNATNSYQTATAGSWTNTAAITSIALTAGNAGNWQQYSTAYLYGTLKGSGGATVS